MVKWLSHRAWSPAPKHPSRFLPDMMNPAVASAVRPDGALATARSRVHARSRREVVAVKIDPMKRTAADIFTDALALPAEARAALASRLRESVHPQSAVFGITHEQRP